MQSRTLEGNMEVCLCVWCEETFAADDRGAAVRAHRRSWKHQTKELRYGPQVQVESDLPYFFSSFTGPIPTQRGLGPQVTLPTHTSEIHRFNALPRENMLDDTYDGHAGREGKYSYDDSADDPVTMERWGTWLWCMWCDEAFFNYNDSSTDFHGLSNLSGIESHLLLGEHKWNKPRYGSPTYLGAGDISGIEPYGGECTTHDALAQLEEFRRAHPFGIDELTASREFGNKARPSQTRE
jgi:hypothetical protein